MNKYTDQKQKQNESQSKRLEYIVEDTIEEFKSGRSALYKLTSTDKECKIQILYIEVSKIVLAPGLSLFITIDKLLNEQVLDIEKFDEDTCLRLIEKHKECLYIITPFIEILFPIEVKLLNKLHSGVVMQKMKEGFSLLKSNIGSLCLIRSTDTRDYEVKLDESIFITSIDKTFKKIYASFDPKITILNGFYIVKMKINPYSFFQYENLLLSSCSINDNLSKDDALLLKKEKIYSNINKYVGYGFYISIILTVFLNLLVTKSIFVIDWYIFIPVLIYIAMILFFHKMKMDEIKLIELKRKDDLKRKIKRASLVGTIIGSVVLFFILLVSTLSYKYSTDYVYDTQKKVFLDSNSFIVNKKYLLDSDAVLKRFIPVYTQYSFDIIVDTPRELPTFSMQYLDLKVVISFYKGDYLLDQNLSKKIEKINEIFTKNINSGLYGNLYTSNKYEYKKILIDIEEDINNLLEVTLNKDQFSSIVSNVTINTKYAKLHNVDN
jgi:hypothetical protein